MTTPPDARDPGRDEDARFAARIAALYAPEPLSPARQAAFDAKLRERLASRGPRRVLRPAFAALALGLALAWALARPGPGADPPGGAALAEHDGGASEAWELRLVDADEPEQDQPLPPEYVAIASAVFEP